MRHFNLRQTAQKSFITAIATVLVLSSTVFAFDTGFYSSNDIFFYNPDATVCSNVSLTVNSSGSNDQKIYNFLISNTFVGYGNQKFGAAQAAGAVGNFFQESGWNFSAVESNGEGHGIAQWSYDRKITLFSLANSMGKQWDDPEVQFLMLKNELAGSYGKTLLSKGFDKLTDPKEAAYMFQQVYEKAGAPNQKNRDDAAQKAYDKYSGLAASGNLSPSSCGATATLASDGSKATFITKDGYAVYIQTDPRWADLPYSTSTIGASACGPASMAMIITALTGKATDLPAIAKVAADGGMYIPGSGSSWGIASYLAGKYNLTATKIPKTVSAVNTAVRSGGYVIMSGQGSIPFTSSGHYIHVRGITDNGQWLVGDSAHKSANETPYDPAYILSMANDNLYSITK